MECREGIPARAGGKDCMVGPRKSREGERGSQALMVTDGGRSESLVV